LARRSASPVLRRFPPRGTTQDQSYRAIGKPMALLLFRGQIGRSGEPRPEEPKEVE